MGAGAGFGKSVAGARRFADRCAGRASNLALALLGDIAKLKSYQASFEGGDRLGFVPYVTKGYIDRAVSLAEELENNRA